MKRKHLLTLFMGLMTHFAAKAQVWFPEGVFTQPMPSMMTVDNQVITISRTGIDANNSYWQVCINDGSSWTKLPLLTLNKTAEILDIKKFQSLVYVSGVFTFDNSSSSAVVRFNGTNWQGIGLFRMPNSTPASVSAMDVQKGSLILGGSFYYIGQDSITGLARFNGAKFSHYFDGCKNCDPNYPVTDIVSNDSVVAISGIFTTIGGRKSKSFFMMYKNAMDTFVNTPKTMERLALDGMTVYATAGVVKDKRIFKISNNTFTDIRTNLDSAININEILMFEGKLIVNGILNIKSNANRLSTARLDGSVWTDISNNYHNANFIATGRNALFALGTQSEPLSIWNPSRFVVRFYPGMALVRARVFIDSNNNCIMEPNEKPLAKQLIKLPFLNKWVISNDKGLAEFMVPNVTSNSFKFSIKLLRNFIKSNCADTAVTKTFIPAIYSDSIQFPVNRIGNVNDIKILLASPRGIQVIKDKKVIYNIVAENVGSNPISGNIYLKKNSLFTSEITEPPTSKLNDSIYMWPYTMLPGEKKIYTYLGYPKDAQFNNNLQFEAKAYSTITTGTNQYALDDADSIPQQVNPNIKAFRKDVYPAPDPGDSITYLDGTDRELRYNISFNNFSTDTIFYAVIIDTLDLNLDMSYIQETGSNKNYYTEVQTDPNNQYKGIIIWHFPNIKLLPNPIQDFENSGSGSYIGFKVVTKPLSGGYYLRNSASVFYDNTFAGNTNSVYVTLSLTGIDELNNPNDALKVFPNPFGQIIELSCDFKAGDRIRLMNVNGQVIMDQSLEYSTNSSTLDLSGYSPGIYYIQVMSGEKLIQKKIVKMF